MQELCKHNSDSQQPSSNEAMLGVFFTQFSSLPRDLQNSLKLNQRFKNVQFQDKVLQRVSSLSVNGVKYGLEDVFVVGHVHTEAIPLFLKIKYILNVETFWVLCGKLLLPCSYDNHFHAYHVKVDNDWILLSPGNELDHQALDTYLLDDRLDVSLRYSV